MDVVYQEELSGELAPYDYEEAALAAAGASLRVGRSETPEQLAAAAKDARVVWLEWTPPMTRDVLESLPECELAMRWGVGYDQIDVAAATSLGIAVANCPSYCTLDVAEHAIGLVLSLTRRIPARDAEMRKGIWRGEGWECQRVSGRTFGVVGFGRIGRRVAALAGALGCRVIAYDVVPPSEPSGSVTMVGFRELLEQSDIVSLHVPLSQATDHLVNVDNIGWMKQGALLVNTSRGRVLEEAAVVGAVESGHLGGAGIDVFETEPLPAGSRLRDLEAVALTPHEAASSPEALADLRREMCDATVSWIETGWAGSVVNPEVRANRRWRGRD